MKLQTRLQQEEQERQKCQEVRNMRKIENMRGFTKEATERKAKRVFGKKYKNIEVKTGKTIGKSKGGQTIKEYHISGEKR